MSAILKIELNVIRVFPAGRDASALMPVSLMTMGSTEGSDRRLQNDSLPVE